MAVPKILALIHSCKGCPHYQYDSGTRYECDITHSHIMDSSKIAPSCPLADYPAETIDEFEQTVLALYGDNRNKYSMHYALMTHVAAKLKTTFDRRGNMVKIQLADSKTIYLHPQYILDIEINPGCAIYFDFDGKHYRLYPDGQSPQLEERVSVQGTDPKEELWTRRRLKT